MIEPLFITTERFDPSEGETRCKYFEWAKNPALTEVVSLDGSHCKAVTGELLKEDWNHIVNDFQELQPMARSDTRSELELKPPPFLAD